MWPWSSSAKYARKRFEEAVYEEAFREIADQKIRPGIWAKVFAEARGDRGKAEALYVEQRAEAIELEARMTLEQRDRQQREARRHAHRLAQDNAAALKAADAQARAAQARAREAFERAEARRQAQEWNRRWLQLLALILMFGPPAGAAWYLYESMRSLPLGISYGLVILLFTTSWIWRDAAKRFAANLRLSVVAGLLFFALAAVALKVSIGASVLWTGLGFMAIVLAALSVVRQRPTKPRASS